MALSLSKNPFGLLADGVEEPEPAKPKKTNKTQKKKEEPVKPRKPIVFPGDLSGQKKQKKKAQQQAAATTSAPQSPASKKSGASSPVIAANGAAAVAPADDKPVMQVIAGREFRNGVVEKFLNALDATLGSQSAFFKVVLAKEGSDELRRLLRDSSYKAIDQIVKDDRWMQGLLKDLRVKHKEYPEGSDLRSKPLRVQFEKLPKLEFANALAGLFSNPNIARNPKKIPAACMIMWDLLPAIFGADLDHSRVINRIADEQESLVGSQGNLKREAPTLMDFIKEAPAPKGKKGKQGKQEKNPATAAPTPSPAPSPAAEEDPDEDPLYNPDTFAKVIPFGWNFLRIQTSFLKHKSPDAKFGGEGNTTRDWYFSGSKADNAFVFWNGPDVYFLLTNGSA